MRANEFAELSAFVAISEELSFRRAAKRLMLTPSTLSHTMRALEERLGLTLMHRTTRKLTLTDAGKALFAEVRPALQSIEAAVERVGRFRDTPHGSIRITVPRSAATLSIIPRLGAFTRAYPDVRCEVIVDNGFVDIVKDGYDAGVRLVESVDREMATLKITGPLRAAVVASPSYWQEIAPPTSPKDLQRHRCIGRRYTGGGDLHRWEFAKASQRLSVSVDGPLVLDAEDFMRDAALQGVGIAMLPEHEIRDEINAGQLVRVLEDWCPEIPGFFLYFPRYHRNAALLEAFATSILSSD